MGIDDNIPISTGLAPSCSKKLVSNTPLVMLRKTPAKTPSIVDALRLVRIVWVEILGCGGGFTEADPAGGSNIFTGWDR
jgi:hypothetical protein